MSEQEGREVNQPTFQLSVGTTLLLYRVLWCDII